MKGQTRNIFSTTACLAAVALVTTVSPVPAAVTHSATASTQETSQAQSVSGKIASVSKDSFTLNVNSRVASKGDQFQQSAPKTMAFQVDKNTTVDGKLQVDATADVTYRVDNGNNIALSVRVM